MPVSFPHFYGRNDSMKVAFAITVRTVNSYRCNFKILTTVIYAWSKNTNIKVYLINRNIHVILESLKQNILVNDWLYMRVDSCIPSLTYLQWQFCKYFTIVIPIKIDIFFQWCSSVSWTSWFTTQIALLAGENLFPHEHFDPYIIVMENYSSVVTNLVIKFPLCCLFGSGYVYRLIFVISFLIIHSFSTYYICTTWCNRPASSAIGLIVMDLS